MFYSLPQTSSIGLINLPQPGTWWTLRQFQWEVCTKSWWEEIDATETITKTLLLMEPDPEIQEQAWRLWREISNWTIQWSFRCLSLETTSATGIITPSHSLRQRNSEKTCCGILTSWKGDCQKVRIWWLQGLLMEESYGTHLIAKSTHWEFNTKISTSI